MKSLQFNFLILLAFTTINCYAPDDYFEPYHSTHAAQYYQTPFVDEQQLQEQNAYETIAATSHQYWHIMRNRIANSTQEEKAVFVYTYHNTYANSYDRALQAATAVANEYGLDEAVAEAETTDNQQNNHSALECAKCECAECAASQNENHQYPSPPPYYHPHIFEYELSSEGVRISSDYHHWYNVVSNMLSLPPEQKRAVLAMYIAAFQAGIAALNQSH